MISILLAVHNGQNQLTATLNSIFVQTYKDWEIMAVDDASTDDTWAILTQAHQQHPLQIKLLKNSSNQGLTKSLIVAEAEARGDFLARIDAGDTFSPDKLERQINFFKKNPGCCLLGTAYINWRTDQEQTVVPPLTDRQIRKNILRKNPFAHSAVMMRRACYKKAGGYNPDIKYAQDYDLWLRLLPVGRAANLPQVLCRRHLDSNSLSYSKQKEQMKQVIKTRWHYINKANPLHYFYFVEPLLLLLTPEIVKRWLKKRD